MNIFTFSYWFSLRPDFFVNWIAQIVLIFFILLFVVSLFLKIYVTKYKVDKLLKKFWRKLSDLLLVMSLLGFLLYFFSYERIYIFSMRVWYLLWLGLFVWWAWNVYKYITIEIPKKRAIQAERDEKRKWNKK